MSAKQKLNASQAYDAGSIEVLEGLEPVRRRPGMYIGGTDERALHHLFAEVLDNAMDEAVAGFANHIRVELLKDGSVRVSDDGRGIPIDPHPKMPDKSALEVVMTTLHAGGKFSDGAYKTSGGLHGVGISVVNALSDRLEVEVTRQGGRHQICFSRGAITQTLMRIASAPKSAHGTIVTFHPDPEIFGSKARFRPSRLYKMARDKAFLRKGVELLWRCDPEMLPADGSVPEQDEFCFPGGLGDFLDELLKDKNRTTTEIFSGAQEDGHGAVEWALCWTNSGFGESDSLMRSFCNTVPTTDGGTHEQGLRAAILKGLRAHAELIGEKKASAILADDAMGSAAALVSVFIPQPEFQGQTKERLSSSEAARLVELSVRDRFDHWLAERPKEAKALIDQAVERAEERAKRRAEREQKRKTAGKRLRLPAKLADCSSTRAEGTELFLVEGDSAGGSAKQARDRATQAILPLRGKILNIASASKEKIRRNAELNDLVTTLGVGLGDQFSLDDLRYERIVIMTDADVDGAHIASLLITFFHQAMPELIRAGRLYLAQPPLFRLSKGAKSFYAMDEEEKDRLLSEHFKPNEKVELSRFKGLGEMTPAQLKSTTMDPGKRSLLRVKLDHDDLEETQFLIETLMGKKAEGRFLYIQEHARFIDEEALDL